jgi:hypothetical protein
LGISKMSSIAQNLFGHESCRYIRQKPVCFLEQMRASLDSTIFKILGHLNNLSFARGFVVSTNMSLTSRKGKKTDDLKQKCK